jgi:hypothetical protein
MDQLDAGVHFFFVFAGLYMKGDDVSSGGCEIRDSGIGVDHHKIGIFDRGRLYLGDELRSERRVWHENAVHDVEMDEARPCLCHFRNLRA